MMLKQGRFLDWIYELFDDLVETKVWDIWIHKVYEKTFDEFKKSLKVAPETTQKVDVDEVKTTIESSKSILSDFSPPEYAGKGVKDGTI